LGTNDGGLGADDVGEDGVERLPAAGVVVAVPRRPTKVLQFIVSVSEKEGLGRRGREVAYVGGDESTAECGGDAGGVEGDGAVHLPELRLQRLHRPGHLRVERL
jgi:hypothetical protein